MRLVDTRMHLGAIPSTTQSWQQGRANPSAQPVTNLSVSLCCARQRTELKHISKSRWRKHTATPPVAASEKGRAGPESSELWDRLATGSKDLERFKRQGEIPVDPMRRLNQ